MHTQRRYATCPQGKSKKKEEEKMHAQRRYATCSQSMSKKRGRKEIADVPRIKRRELVQKKEFVHHPPKISTHLHILIKVYDFFLL